MGDPFPAFGLVLKIFWSATGGKGPNFLVEILIQMGVWRGKDSLIKENTARVRASIASFVLF